MSGADLWKKSKLKGEYDAYAFGDEADFLGDLVKNGIKTATTSVYKLYELDEEELPKAGEYSIILDSQDEALCIIKTTKVYIEKFANISASYAYKEGEGDRSLEYWKRAHKAFFEEELKEYDLEFDEQMDLVCEEFEVVYKQ